MTTLGAISGSQYGIDRERIILSTPAGVLLVQVLSIRRAYTRVGFFGISTWFNERIILIVAGGHVKEMRRAEMTF